MTALVLAAFWSYVFTMCVGFVAYFSRRRFGWVHHALYLVVSLLVVGALVMSRRWELLGTIACLALLSRFRARSFWHPALAGAGLVALAVTVLRIT